MGFHLDARDGYVRAPPVAVRRQHLQHPHGLRLPRHLHGRAPKVARATGRGARLQQRPRALRQVVGSHALQRRQPVRVHCRRVRPSRQQEGHRVLVVARHAARVQRRGSTRGYVIHQVRVCVE